MTSDGLVMDQQSVVVVFNKQFSLWVGESGDQKDKRVNSSIPDDFSWLNCVFKFKKIEEEDVLKLLYSLDMRKSAGVDNISRNLLKYTAPAVSGRLAKLFNNCLQTGEIPWEWKAARVTLIHKGGDAEIVENYCPVSVLLVVNTVMEKLVYQQLYSYLQEYTILSSAQLGFCPHHST